MPSDSRPWKVFPPECLSPDSTRLSEGFSSPYHRRECRCKSLINNNLRWQTNVCPSMATRLQPDVGEFVQARVYPVRVFVVRSALTDGRAATVPTASGRR
jgi:hypothetical protein